MSAAYRSSADKDKPGLDLRADIDTVVGFSDTSMRDVRLQLQQARQQAGRARCARQAGGRQALQRRAAGPGEGNEAARAARRCEDAGQLFKVVGFYPNAFGGEMNLEVNLDGQGPADRTGTLWARDFYVLGDPIISEVLQNADGNSPSGTQPASAARPWCARSSNSTPCAFPSRSATASSS